jgi:predicted GIY-YIG superfamily endonuclease
MLHYVYILRSEIAPERHYIGMTSDLEQRDGRDGEGKSK